MNVIFKFEENELFFFTSRIIYNFMKFVILSFLPPATKLGQGYIFTGVYDSVHGSGWGVSAPGVPARGGYLLGGACLGGARGLPGPGGGAVGDPPGMATAAGGKHPTGMHSC